jgi:hypothetical protein
VAIPENEGLNPMGARVGCRLPPNAFASVTLVESTTQPLRSLSLGAGVHDLPNHLIRRRRVRGRLKAEPDPLRYESVGELPEAPPLPNIGIYPAPPV